MGENETKIKVSFSNSVTNAGKLDKYAERLKEVYSLLQAIDKGKGANITFVDIKTKQLKKSTDSAKTSVKGLGSEFEKAFSVAKIGAFIKSLEVLSNRVTNLIKLSASYVENINLLEVAYANVNKETGQFNESIESSSKRIEDYIDKMSDIYGLDESRLTRQFGVFKQLANAMELPTETAENLSEIMVKMTNDIASLYNLDLSRASNALQSALVGQVRPIRGATGADITEKTLQKTVDELGIDRSISQLSFVEKRLIMVISLTKQLKNSQGDWARTIESTSNQMRIFQEQWDRLSRTIGNIFYPILEKVFPYLNAILMVLTEIFNLIASLLGFKMPEFDYSSLASTSDAVLDLEDELSGASAGVDTLKQKLSGLRGFDKLNVISSPKDSGSSASAGAGVDPAIMDAFNASFSKYNDMMDEVNMKANQIRDAILDWLGFTDGTYTKLKLIGAILGTMVGLKIFTILKKLFTGEGFLAKLLGTGGLYKTITNLLKKIKEFNILGKIFSPAGLLVGGILALAGALVYAYKNNDEFKKSVDDFVKVLIDTAIPIIEDLLDILKMLWNDVLKPLWENAIKPIAKILVETLVPTLTVLMSILKPIIKDIIGPLLEALIKLIEFALKPITTVIKVILEVIGSILKTGQKIWEFLEPFFKFVVEKIENKIKPAIDSIGGVITKIKDAIQKVVDWWNNLSFNKKELHASYTGGGSGAFGGGSGGGVRAEGGIFANGQWHDITAYAGGGLPPVGQMFVAREAGPELVGKIGSHTAVMNNDQIVGSVASGVYNAVREANRNSQVINPTFVIQVGDEKVANVVLENLQDMAKTNGKPIVIGG